MRCSFVVVAVDPPVRVLFFIATGAPDIVVGAVSAALNGAACNGLKLVLVWACHRGVQSIALWPDWGSVDGLWLSLDANFEGRMGDTPVKLKLCSEESHWMWIFSSFIFNFGHSHWLSNNCDSSSAGHLMKQGLKLSIFLDILENEISWKIIYTHTLSKGVQNRACLGRLRNEISENYSWTNLTL